MHLDEHVEGIDAEYGGGGGGGKHGETVRCGAPITVIGITRASSCDRTGRALLVRGRVAHLSAVQRSRRRRDRVAAWRNGVVSDGGGHTTMTVGVYLLGGSGVSAKCLLKTRGEVFRCPRVAGLGCPPRVQRKNC